MQIRNYRIEDHKQVEANLKAENMYYEAWYSVESLADFSVKHPDNFLVAEIDGVVVGSIMIVPMGLQWAMIFGLVVKKEFRGHSIATKLLEAANKYAKEHHIDELAMLVDSNDSELLNFYDKRGFAYSTEKTFRYLWRSPTKDGEK